MSGHFCIPSIQHSAWCVRENALSYALKACTHSCLLNECGLGTVLSPWLRWAYRGRGGLEDRRVLRLPLLPLLEPPVLLSWVPPPIILSARCPLLADGQRGGGCRKARGCWRGCPQPGGSSAASPVIMLLPCLAQCCKGKGTLTDTTGDCFSVLSLPLA